MMDQELRDFLSLSVGTLTAEINRLSGVVKEQSNLIRDIEIKSTTRVAELQKDIEDIRRDITDIKQEQHASDDSQKFKWKSLSEDRARQRDMEAIKEAEQAVINSSMRTVNKLLWTIIGIMLTIGITYVWTLIVNGGVKGLP